VPLLPGWRARAYWEDRFAIPGWFEDVDFLLFDQILERQSQGGVVGDLLEIGTYLGKSAVVLGSHVRDGERLTVCDLFEDPGAGAENDREQSIYYSSLTRRSFETNYRLFLPELPVIVQGLSLTVGDHVAPASLRFAHVDGSHLYEHVHEDLVAVESLMQPGGIVVCDDFRSHQAPGVAAAVWQAVFERGFQPIIVSNMKLYGTWGPPDEILEALRSWLTERPEIPQEEQQVFGQALLRVENVQRHGRLAPVKRFLPPILSEALAARRERIAVQHRDTQDRQVPRTRSH
jgi:hypothetical protein